MDFSEQITLGRTGLQVGRLGISSSYGAPSAAFKEAFDRGCNYWTWGAFIKGRSSEMKAAIKWIIREGRREELVMAMVSYAHNGTLTEYFLKRGLKAAGLDYTDVLILGYFSKPPPRRVIDSALDLKEKGLVRYIGLTSHNRKVFPLLANDDRYDVFHVRYNAAHRGAETETFPFITGADRSGVISFTATSWQQLLKPGKMPRGETAASAPDCYRFVLSHPGVDICMVGAKTLDQMRQNLTVLDTGPMTPDELHRMRRIGDYVYCKR